MSKILTVTLCCFSCLAAICIAGETAKLENAAILFYGKVVNQYYKPVSGANVHARISYYAPNGTKKVRSITVTTNSKGLFVLKSIGYSVYLEKIEKSGCEFPSHKNPTRSFDYSAIYPEAIFVPDKNSPIIFHVREAGNGPAYLIRRPSLERNFLPDEKQGVYNLNLIGTWIDADGKLHRALKGGHTDLTIKYNLSKDKSAYELVFLSRDTNSGVLVKDELLDEAPIEGYKPETKIAVNIPKEYNKKQTYLYVKARGGQAYSRLDLEFEVRPSILRVGANLWANPAGSRNLKYDKDFQEYEKKRRYQEKLRTAQEKAKHPYKPRN